MIQAIFREDILYGEVRDVLDVAAQRSCPRDILGGVQGQGGWRSAQPGLVKGVPAHGRGSGNK